MPTARRDFEGFVRWLHQLPEAEAPSNVRRFTNLVLANFDEISATARQHNQRSNLLVRLARRNLMEISDALPEIASRGEDEAWLWSRLRQLTVGPFRGFRNEEIFDLRRRIVLFYGPNGSGKTSLCEALEYALLGSVEEAEAKRIPPEVYLANIHVGRFLPPVLIATDNHENNVNVRPNVDAYRFLFIEKNRIDSFSRIATKPNAQRAELISTLFGMERFNDFVSHFNDSMDGQLALTNIKRDTLATRRTALAQDEAIINGQVAVLRALSDEEQALANRYAPGMIYDDLKNLIGNADNPSRLQKLNEILNVIPPQILNVSGHGLQAAYRAADVALDELNNIADSLQARANQVSFKDLYTAVLALQSSEGAHCPACNTPLEGGIRVVRNPYEKAMEGLGQLRELAELQVNYKRAQETVAETSRALKGQLAVIHQFLNREQDTVIGRYLAGVPQEGEQGWWKVVYQAEDDLDGLPALNQILDIAQRIETQDAASRLALQERQRNIDERDRLIRFQLLVQGQDNKRLQYTQSVEAARTRVGAFDVDNARLIQEAAQEGQDNQRDTPIKLAYDRFLILLRRYRNQLPGTLMAGLNDQAMLLYNGFNRNDLDVDKLASLHLPLAGNQKIEISFRGRPGVREDALKILSEGHIRCLGLAILLAKNMSMNSPLIVFDDAINAIDHDHRRGIRETIFESDYFINAQIIVTCHSHEFIKDVQQSLSPEDRNNSKVYLFRNHDGNYHPRINGNVPSRNYVGIARAAREELNDRGALDASRKAIEMFAEKIWKWLESHEHGTISVQLAGVRSEPALRNLCEALRKKLVDTQVFVHPNKASIVAALEVLLGIPEQNLVWTYLNKGTHEEADRDDFDRDIVETVVVTLERLESLDFRPGR